MEHCPFSESAISAGKKLVEAGKIENILFSEGTYQFTVSDLKSKKTFSPFLQITDRGDLKEAFCSCTAAEKNGGCPHLAAAWSVVFREKGQPLHLRFRNSLWNLLCQMEAQRIGYEEKLLKKDPKGGYFAPSVTHKKLFSVRPLTLKGKEQLKQYVEERPIETEETSLKFFNLSPDELALWREGRPSPRLSYELSFWSDLAKWFFLLSEAKKDYRFTVDGEEGKLPAWIHLQFSDVSASFYVPEASWPHLIPALKTVIFPLTLQEMGHVGIQKAIYDPLLKEIQIDVDPQSEKKTSVEKGIQVGEWTYLPGQGFYPTFVDPLFREKIIPSSQIGRFLERHAHLMRKYLEGVVIHSTSIKINYDLFFDQQGALHLRCWSLEKGDLQLPSSGWFFPWIYLHGKGFYRLEDVLFNDVEKIIPKSEVSEFIARHRNWLHAFEGFETHVAKVESQMTYTVMSDHALRFDAHLGIGEDQEEMIDFGDWLYVKGRGFYPKLLARGNGAVRPGLIVPARDVCRFMRLHRDELEQVKDFFSTRCPLEKSGIDIALNAQGKIVVTPRFFFFPAYQSKQVVVFGEFAYVPGEGFSEIPPLLRIPEAYLEEVVIASIDEPYFVAYELEALTPFILSIDPRLVKPKQLNLAILKLRQEAKGRAPSWIVRLEYQSEMGVVSAHEVWRAIQDNQRYLFSSAGLLFLKIPRLNWLKNVTKKRWLKQGKELRLTTLEWIRINVFEETAPPKDGESRALFDSLDAFHTPESFNVEGLHSQLRPYQETGLKWLWFLYHYGLSGLLCDEMGLGKTHQAMALLAAALNSTQGVKFLVVCPTSVIFHWEELLRRFLPKMRVRVFYGVHRTLEGFDSNQDLLLTSYGTLRSEREALSKLSFEIAVFDEVQIAKNPYAQTHKALKKMRAKMHLGLTGTPIENRLLELKALFDLILPGYFPVEKVFRELFVNPIEKNQDPQKKALLARLVRPFILRRKKSEVLQDLPEKVEEIAYCMLSDEQRQLYQNAYLAERDQLLSELSDENKPVPFLHVFALLSTLKQICDHPCLISKQITEYAKHQSGKWDLFVELLQEARDSGQKLVVFSQYLDMLNIIEAYLKENKIGFATIRGSTRDRKEQVVRFRDDPHCEVFVGSLQAAGVGIDLIAASVVIHYDRWWNPAKENQATDRVHRIGQSRNVQVFKMVTKGTIEENIHRLIEKKLALFEGVIGFDDQDQIKGLNRQELITLLQQLDLKN